MTKEVFISKARNTHGDLYDYSDLPEILNQRDKLPIKCSIHGLFLQDGGNHISRCGCPKCSKEEFSKKRTLSHEDFFSRIPDSFKEKYDYSETRYINSDIKIKVICNTHGEFLVGPFYHLGGTGCKKCSYEKNGERNTLSTEEFIAKAKAKHGDRYDYSKTEYTGQKEKLTVGCKEHGNFEQIASVHLNSGGCPICGDEKRKMLPEEFFKRAKEIHNNKFSYEKAVFTGTKNKIIVTCPTHGDFEVLAMRHLTGSDCKLCLYESKKLTQEEFINKSKIVHGDKYDYSKVIYTGNRDKVEIGCPTHSWFIQNAANHLAGQGCILCGSALNGFNRRLSSEEWTERAISKYIDKFDYSETVYTHNRENVTIRCIEHNIKFSVNPDNHMTGLGGCPSCNGSVGENVIIDFLEKHKIKYEKQKTFTDCRNDLTNYLLYFDFYLPKFNMCIEFDGEQHFKATEFFGGQEGLESLQYRDNIKSEYCKTNNIGLLRIPYMNVNSIDKILTLKLNL